MPSTCVHTGAVTGAIASFIHDRTTATLWIFVGLIVVTGGSVVRSSVLPAFYRNFFPRDEAPPVPPAGFAERAGRYAGDYGFWRGNFSGIEKALGLTSVVKVAPGATNNARDAASGRHCPGTR